MTLEAELVADLKPVGRLEHLLVQRIAVVHWRFNRAYRYEAAGVTSARGHFANYRDQHEPYADPSWIVLPEDDDLDKLLRYEGMLDRELNRTLNQLTRLQFLRLRRDKDTDPDDGEAPTEPTAIRAPNAQGATDGTSHGWTFALAPRTGSVTTGLPPCPGGTTGGGSTSARRAKRTHFRGVHRFRASSGEQPTAKSQHRVAQNEPISLPSTPTYPTDGRTYREQPRRSRHATGGRKTGFCVFFCFFPMQPQRRW